MPLLQMTSSEFVSANEKPSQMVHETDPELVGLDQSMVQK